MALLDVIQHVLLWSLEGRSSEKRKKDDESLLLLNEIEKSEN